MSNIFTCNSQRTVSIGPQLKEFDMHPRHTFLISKTALFGVLLVLAGLTSVTVAADSVRSAETNLVSKTMTVDTNRNDA